MFAVVAVVVGSDVVVAAIVDISKVVAGVVAVAVAAAVVSFRIRCLLMTGGQRP